MYDSISNTSIPTEHEQQATELQNQREIEYQKYLNKKHAIFESEYYRFMDQYANLQEMFESTNGFLYSAETVSDQSKTVIMKKIWRNGVATFHDAGDGRECPNEIWYHIKAQKASPKLIVPLLDWFEFEEFYLAVMPMIDDAQDLWKLLQQHGPLSEERAKNIFRQLVQVCDDLHQNGICHRDIKDENVLIDKHDRIYLIDFGTTMDYDSSYSDLVGTECFFSPEFFDRGFFRPEELTVWSLGAILYILLVRCWRFDRQTQSWNRSTTDERHLSASAIQLIDQVLNPIPEHRATLAEISNAEWLSTSAN